MLKFVVMFMIEHIYQVYVYLIFSIFLYDLNCRRMFMGSWRSFDIPPEHPGSLVCINFHPFFFQNSPSWRKTLIFSSHPSLMLARPDVVNADNYVSSKMPHIQLRSHSEGPFNVGDFWSRGTETHCY